MVLTAMGYNVNAHWLPVYNVLLKVFTVLTMSNSLTVDSDYSRI